MITLPDGYSVVAYPPVGFLARDPGGFPISELLSTYDDAVAACDAHWQNELALGAMPHPKPLPPIIDGSEALPLGITAIGRGPVTVMAGPRPGAVYSPQIGGHAAISGEAAIEESG